MDRYLSGEEIDPKVLIEDLEKAVARGSFYPVLVTSAPQRIGMTELLEVMTEAFPSPAEHPLPAVTTPDGTPATGLSADPAGPLLAEVVKTTSDPYVGRISLVRVFSGTLRPDASVHVSGHGRSARGHNDHDDDERIGALTAPLGKQQRPLTQCAAGDICAVAKLGTAETGDTLSDKDRPLLMEPWSMPEPLLPAAIVARSKADEDKLSQALGRLVAEDPTLRLENNPETHQLVLWTMGEAHIDVLLDRLGNRHGVAVETVDLRVPLRETIGGKAQGLGRNVKQTGGHGEYGIAHVEVEPLDDSASFEFVDKIVGGVVPRQFIPSVEKGVRWQMEQGVLAGYPMTGVRVTLYDGKAHSVDSSDMAFQKAGRLALKDAVDKAQPMLLEPVDEVSVLVPDDYVGAVMSDLSSRRGRVLGTEPVGVGRTLVRAEIPELEITRYTIDLRSLSHGTGSFTRQYLRHQPLPSHLAGKVADRGQGVAARRQDSGRGPGVGQQLAGCRPAAGAAPGCAPMTGMKLVSPPHLGTTCWCRWAAMPAPATEPRFMPMLKPCGAGGLAQRADGALGELGEFGGLGGGQVGVVGHVPVRDDEQVPGVVRVQVEHRVDQRAAGHDQAVLVAQRGRAAERAALVLARARRLALALDVGHPVRRPQPPESVGDAREDSRRRSRGTGTGLHLDAVAHGGGDLRDGLGDRDAVLLRPVAVAERHRARGHVVVARRSA